MRQQQINSIIQDLKVLDAEDCQFWVNAIRRQANKKRAAQAAKRPALKMVVGGRVALGASEGLAKLHHDVDQVAPLLGGDIAVNS